MEQDLVEKRPRSRFQSTSRKIPSDNRDYWLDAFSDLLRGAFFCNTRTRCCPDAGIEALPPSTISLAVILRPYTSALASSSGRSEEPSRETPANRPRDRE